MVHGVGSGDWGQHMTNNNNNIIRITIKELGRNKKGEEE